MHKYASNYNSEININKIWYHSIGNNIQFKQIIEESFHLIMYLHLFSTKHFSHSFVIYSQDSQYNNNIQISFYNGPYILHLELLEFYKNQISVYQHRGIYKIMSCFTTT